jgi:hypothetical protein
MLKFFKAFIKFKVFFQIAAFHPIWSHWTESSAVGTKKSFPAEKQGCQIIYFQTKNPNLGKFWMALEWKMLV